MLTYCDAMEILKVLPKQLQKLPPLFLDFQPPGELSCAQENAQGSDMLSVLMEGQDTQSSTLVRRLGEVQC